MKRTKKYSVALLAFVVAALVATTPAKADQVEYVSLAFQSGATFAGTLDFTSDYSQITGVSGTLTDYMSAPWNPSLTPLWSGPACLSPTTGPTAGCPYLNYQSGSSDYFSWIWPGANTASGTDDYATSLMDGTGEPDYLNFIYFTYNHSSAPALTVAPGDLFLYDRNNVLYSGVQINYYDPLVSGSISPGPAPTPEPSSLMLLGTGLVGLAGIARRKFARA